jgi:putative flippase GtrA
MPRQTFRYAACGGANTVLGFLLYAISFKYFFKARVVQMGFLAFKPHNASLMVAFMINFPVGFILMKYIVFVGSNLKGRIQLVRYFFVFVANLFLNYFLLKGLVEYWNVQAIVAQIISTVVVIVISYLLQQHFSFKTKEEE